MAKFPDENTGKEEIVELAARYLCPNRVDTFQKIGAVPVMGRREGNYIWDMDGRKLFDVHINGGTYNLGHRNPEIISSMTGAMEHYDIGNHHFPSGPRARLAERLVSVTPGNMRYTVFTPCGAEAIDVAIRSARRATGRRKIVSFTGSYHGHGTLGLRAGQPDQAKFFLSEQPEHEVVQVPFNDAGAVQKALSGKDVAAMVCEVIPATSGFPMPSPEYYPAVQELCRKTGTMVIADEVQTGLMRTGEMWACRAYGLEPNVLVTGKGLSGGIYPIAAAVMTEEAGTWLAEDGWAHSSTFGGSELGCVVAQKVLEIIQRPEVIENVQAMAGFFSAGLREIQDRHPFLVEVRQNGLVMGLRFDNPLGGVLMTACCYETGIWAFPAGFERSVLQFKPNLLVDKSAGEELLTLLEQSLELCEKKLPGGGNGQQ